MRQGARTAKGVPARGPARLLAEALRPAAKQHRVGSGVLWADPIAAPAGRGGGTRRLGFVEARCWGATALEPSGARGRPKRQARASASHETLRWLTAGKSF